MEKQISRPRLVYDDGVKNEKKRNKCDWIHTNSARKCDKSDISGINL